MPCSQDVLLSLVHSEEKTLCHSPKFFPRVLDNITAQQIVNQCQDPKEDVDKNLTPVVTKELEYMLNLLA